MSEKINARAEQKNPEPETSSHIPVQSLYGPADLAGWDRIALERAPADWP